MHLWYNRELQFGSSLDCLFSEDIALERHLGTTPVRVNVRSNLEHQTLVLTPRATF
jgi:hypothetical protein